MITILKNIFRMNDFVTKFAGTYLLISSYMKSHYVYPL